MDTVPMFESAPEDWLSIYPGDALVSLVNQNLRVSYTQYSIHWIQRQEQEKDPNFPMITISDWWFQITYRSSDFTKTIFPYHIHKAPHRMQTWKEAMEQHLYLEEGDLFMVKVEFDLYGNQRGSAYCPVCKKKLDEDIRTAVDLWYLSK